MKFSAVLEIRGKLNCINAEIEKLRELASAPSSPRLDGTASGGGDITAGLAVRLADLTAVRESLVSAYWANLVELHRVIAGVPDITTRLYFTARYVDGLSWSAIAKKFSDPGHPLTAEAAKKYTQRALKKFAAEHREQEPQEEGEMK